MYIRLLLALFSLLFMFSLASGQDVEMKGTFAIAIHGGAGNITNERMTLELEQEYGQKLREALTAGYKILESGGMSVDAVEAAIKVMEDSPLFNAGKGSVYTNAETQEMDASIMEGKELNAGAVAVVTNIRNPISAARAVMERSEHVMLTGDGALEFAKEQGLAVEDDDYFFDESRYRQLQQMKQKDTSSLDHDSDKGQVIQEGDKYGTVGAVALDVHGNLAAGTSTGGMTNKKFGRIGDSPVIGAGTYADNSTCAVSGTGHGEYFMRYLVAYDVSARMKYKKLDLQEAARQTLLEQLTEKDGRGGFIAVDNKGNIVWLFNTEGMFRAKQAKGGEAVVQMYGE